MTFQFCDKRCLSCETDSVSVCAADLEIRSLNCNRDSINNCGVDVNGSIRTIKTDQNSVLATLPSSSTHSQIGRMFSCPFEFTLEPGIKVEFIVTNPPDSGRIMYIDTVFVGSLLLPAEQPLSFGSEIGIVMHRDSQPDINAINVTIRNLNFGFPDNSLMSSTLNVQNSPENQGPVVMQTRQSLGLFPFDFSGKIIVPPGHSFSVEVSIRLVIGASDNVVPVGLTITWYELDVPTV